MNKKELFVKYHWKQTMVLGVVCLAFVSFMVVLEDSNIFKAKSDGEVRGSFVEVPKGAEVNEIEIYQRGLKNILNDYFSQRAEFSEPHQDWLFLINSIRFRVMQIRVPDQYKDLHLKVISQLDREFVAVKKGGDEDIEVVSDGWAAILNQYFWLNY